MDFANFFLGVVSLFVCYFAVRSIKKKGAKTYNVFLISFFLCLLLNTTKLSIYQKEKDLLDVYYLLTGPLVLTVFLYIFEHYKCLKLKSLNLVPVDLAYAILLGGYVLVKLYISSIVGWRIDSLQVGTMLISGDELTVPGFSGLAISLQWILLMLTPSVSKKRRWMCVVFGVALSVFAFLHVKRGDIMRMGIFFLALYLIRMYQPKRIRAMRSSKGTFRLVAIVAVILVFFVITGNIREEARGGDVMGVIYDSGVKIDNPVIAWTYSYFALNVDVLKLYYPKIALGESAALLSMIKGEEIDFVGQNINGFNASTFLMQFIVDYQEWFFFELIVFSLIIGFIILISRSVRHKGMYAFVLALIILFPFGNYFQTRAIIVSLFLFVILSMVLNNNSFAKQISQ